MFGLLWMTGVSGCESLAWDAQEPVRDEDGRVLVEATHTAEPVRIDGRLDDAVWARAPRYALVRADRTMRGRPTVEPEVEDKIEAGTVQLAWDANFLYVAGCMKDSDIMAVGDKDQLPHTRLGDVLEVFLRPMGFTWYWELYATPASRKTLYFYPGPGHHHLHSTQDHDPSPLVVFAEVKGTLNHWEDVDEGWTVEMGIPLTLLTGRGERFEPGAHWTVLIGRYNYSRYFERTGPQLTMFPKLPRSNFHDRRNYGRLIISWTAQLHSSCCCSPRARLAAWFRHW